MGLPVRLQKLIDTDLSALRADKPPPKASAADVRAALNELEKAGRYDHFWNAYLWRKSATAEFADPAARIHATRALAYRAREDGLALLHLRVHAGDDDPRVAGACFEAALRIAPASSVEFVAGFLDATAPGIAEEAALALGDSRRDEAFEVLRDWCGRTVDPDLRQAGLRAMALLRREEAFDFLVQRVREGAPSAARETLQALAVLRGDAARAERVRAAAAERDEPEVKRALREAFG